MDVDGVLREIQIQMRVGPGVLLAGIAFVYCVVSLLFFFLNEIHLPPDGSNGARSDT